MLQTDLTASVLYMPLRKDNSSRNAVIGSLAETNIYVRVHNKIYVDAHAYSSK